MATLPINPWTGIWVRTRETIRAIVQTNPNYMYFFFCFIVGLMQTMDTSAKYMFSGLYSKTMVIIGWFIVSMIVGFLIINIQSGLLFWIGKWLGGKGPYQHIRAIVSWSHVPTIISILTMGIVIFGNLGEQAYQAQGQQIVMSQQGTFLAFALVFMTLVLGIWSFIILLRGLSEVQGFSLWRSFFNILLPGLLIFVVAVVIMLLAGLMIGPTPAPIPAAPATVTH